MNISTYLAQAGISQSDFAREIGVPPALIYQWMNGIRPVAVKHCAKIERKTAGAVTRKELRPDDWPEIWPDLSRRKAEKPPPPP